MANISISDLNLVDSDFLVELSPEEEEAIAGGGWIGALVGGTVGTLVGVAVGWPSGPGMAVSGIAGAGLGAGFGSEVEDSIW